LTLDFEHLTGVSIRQAQARGVRRHRAPNLMSRVNTENAAGNLSLGGALCSINGPSRS
jgi:hypothetical protein